MSPASATTSASSAAGAWNVRWVRASSVPAPVNATSGVVVLPTISVPNAVPKILVPVVAPTESPRMVLPDASVMPLPPLLPMIGALPAIRSPLGSYPWRLRALLAQIANVSQDNVLAGHGPIDLFHATEHLLPRLKRAPAVFTLHDLIFRALSLIHI